MLCRRSQNSCKDACAPCMSIENCSFRADKNLIPYEGEDRRLSPSGAGQGGSQPLAVLVGHVLVGLTLCKASRGYTTCGDYAISDVDASYRPKRSLVHKPKHAATEGLAKLAALSRRAGRTERQRSARRYRIFREERGGITQGLRSSPHT